MGQLVGLSLAGGGPAGMDPGVKMGFSGKMVQTGNGIFAQQAAGQPQNLPRTYSMSGLSLSHLVFPP